MILAPLETLNVRRWKTWILSPLLEDWVVVRRRGDAGRPGGVGRHELSGRHGLVGRRGFSGRRGLLEDVDFLEDVACWKT